MNSTLRVHTYNIFFDQINKSGGPQRVNLTFIKFDNFKLKQKLVFFYTKVYCTRQSRGAAVCRFLGIFRTRSIACS